MRGGCGSHGWPARARAVAIAAVPVTAAGAKALSHDVNGDGLADVAFTDYIDSIDSPGATVVYGARDRSAPASRDAPGLRGFRVTGDETLTSAEVVRDVNGDGLVDVLASTTGEAFVVYGRRIPAAVKLVASRFAKGVSGTRFELPYDEVRDAGDVDGDGLADVVSVDQGRRALARVRPARAQSRCSAASTSAPAGASSASSTRRSAPRRYERRRARRHRGGRRGPHGRRDGFDVERWSWSCGARATAGGSRSHRVARRRARG
jgi:hypothetical protein